MSKNDIYRRLGRIGIGMTTTINDHVVTRWAYNKFEVDTWNKPHSIVDHETAAADVFREITR